MSRGPLEEVLQGRLGRGKKEGVEGAELRGKGWGRIIQGHAGHGDKSGFYCKHAHLSLHELLISSA